MRDRLQPGKSQKPLGVGAVKLPESVPDISVHSIAGLKLLPCRFNLSLADRASRRAPV